jgi:prepilin-type N-terminal cleavage/methylation domain-containing protein
MRARAFTLFELMIVVAIFAVLSALAVPSIVSLVRANAGREVVERVKTEVAIARDRARGRDACFRFASDPAAPAPGPYVLSIEPVACPGETSSTASSIPTSTEAMGPKLRELKMRRVVNGNPDATVTSLTFGRDGSLASPLAAVRFDLVVDDSKHAFLLYPAAGTIEEIRQ